MAQANALAVSDDSPEKLPAEAGADPALAAIESMEGLERAAVLLMTLGEEYAAEILKHLDPREVHKIGATMAALPGINRTQVSGVLAAFNQEVADLTSMGVGSQDYVRSVLIRALGRDKAKGVMDSIIKADNASGVEALKWMEAEAIAGGLRQEHPQVVALVLSSLEAQQSAEVLGLLPEELRHDAMLRVATLDGIPANALLELNEVIEKQVMTAISRSARSKVGGPQRAAEILNLLSGDLEGSLLEHLKEADPELAAKVEEMMLVFESLMEVEDRGIQTLLREISSETLMVALRGADEMVKEKVLRNMSKRAAEMLRDDLEVMPPVRLSEVDTAQKEILATAKRLAEAGEISLGVKGGDALV